MVYSEIDKNSNLLWPVKDEFELLTTGNGQLGKMKRSTRSGRKDEDKKESEDWQKNTNASFGYGEITKVSKIV
jgi:hypothetical protein